MWKSDGTEVGTVRVKDIVAGAGSSSPKNLTNVNGTLYFSAYDSTGGIELWKSDGTEVGTVRVKDINSGTGNSSPQNLTNVNGILYFSATDSSGDVELWKSDGTQVGTVRVKDINPGTGSSSPQNLTDVNGILYFRATDSSGDVELWKSDGTEAGTIRVKDINSTGNSNPFNLTNVNGTLYFTATDSTGGHELWKSDGTEAGTVRVKDLFPGLASSNPSDLTYIDGKLYFVADNGNFGRELFKIDLNNAPTDLSLSNTSVNENVFADTVIGNLSTTDPNTTDTHTYTLVSGVGSTDNSLFSITNGNQLTINTSPDYEAKNSYSIRVRTTDHGGLSYEKAIAIAVHNINESPIVNIPGQQTFNEDNFLTFSAANSNAISITDPDAGDNLFSVYLSVKGNSSMFGGNLSLYTTDGLTNLDSTGNGLSFKGTLANINAALQELTFYPYMNVNGSGSLMVMISEVNEISSGGGSVALQITPVNDAPTLSLGITPTVNEDEPFSFSFFSGYDVDDPYMYQPLTYTATLADGSVLPTWLNFDANSRTFSGTASNSEVGTIDIKVTASDGEATGSDVFTLAIANTNDAPMAVDDSITTDANKPIIISAATLLANDTDVDTGDVFNITSWTAPSHGSLVDNGNNTYTYTPTANYFGTDSFTYTVTDAHGGSSTASVNITINAVAKVINGTSNSENLTGSAAQDFIFGFDGNDTLKGLGNNDSLDGGNGNDVLDGGSGEDALKGGAGNDTYFIDSINDTIVEDLDAGTDIVNASVSWALGEHLENLTLAGTVAINGTGNSLNNILTGNAASNALVGAEGNDTLKGLGGNDNLDGGSDNDVLDGGTGDDTMIGGAGNDTYYIDSINDSIVEDLNAGTDTVNASVSWELGEHLENLTLAGTVAINGTGNSLNNILTGNAASNTLVGSDGNDNLKGLGDNDSLNGGSGNDVLDGGTGNDTLIGGAGNDIYYIDSSTDSIVEDVNAGTDTVNASVSWVLAANLENLTLTGTLEINGTGNNLNNQLVGNAANNTLLGGNGNDTLKGLAGYDSLNGGSGNDVLDGGTDNDILLGGVGKDTLTGGSGQDSFYLTDTRTGGWDTLNDFNPGDDTILISKSEFELTQAYGTLDAGIFRLGTAATTASDRFIYNQTTGGLFFDADGVGAVTQIQIAQLYNKASLSNTNITVIA